VCVCVCAYIQLLITVCCFRLFQSRQGSQELSHSPSRLPRPNRNLDEVMTQSELSGKNNYENDFGVID